MKADFKPLVLATAVAAVSAGYAHAEFHFELEPGPGLGAFSRVSTNSLGDLAIIPYYTVAEAWGTGLHVINTSDSTQVVKLRFRRGSDSLDALDINLILSPEDEWTGFLNDGTDEDAGDESTIRLTTQDSTCTAPLPTDGGWDLPTLYREGATEGYIEVIAMGAAIAEGNVNLVTGKVSNSLAWNAKHKDGVPRDCVAVEANFLDGNLDASQGGDPDGPGMKDADTSLGPYVNPENGDNEFGFTNYVDGGNVLKVSWFIRDSATGVEFGDDAYHLENFSDFRCLDLDELDLCEADWEKNGRAWMTHQEQGWFSGNLSGFDFPDLNGGSPRFNFNYLGVEGDEPEIGELAEPRPMYLALRAAFGVDSVINDWSANPELNVGTDWVITIPGQYVMLDLPEYVRSDKFDPNNDGKCLAEDPDWDLDFHPGVGFGDGGFGCDQRDIPVTAAFLIYDREELLVTEDSDRGVVVSPSIPGQLPTTELRNEVNVIHWGDRPVMSSQYDITVDTSALDEVSGWSKLAVSSKTTFGDPTQSICMWRTPGFDPRDGAGDPNDWMGCHVPTFDTTPPMIGFVAWERSFPQNPDGNYGRAVKHSFETRSVSIFDGIDGNL